MNERTNFNGTDMFGVYKRQNYGSERSGDLPEVTQQPGPA